MGALVEEAIRRASQALVAHDADAGPRRHQGRRPDQRRPARGLTARSASTIATQQPVARDLRYLLTLDHVTYELERIGDHAASVAKQVIKLAPEPPLADYVHLPEMAELGAQLVHGVLRALVDVDAVAAREVAVLRRRDRPPVPRDLRRGRRADARRTRPTSSAGRGSSSRPTTSSGSATASPTSPRTSSILVTGDVEDLNP